MSLSDTLTRTEAETILRLAEVLDRSKLNFLAFEVDGFSISITRDAPGDVVKAQAPAEAATATVNAPAVGIYRQAVDASVGMPVETGATLGQIETLDQISTVVAAAAGTIAELCVQDGAFVEYGQLLLKVRPHAPAA